jgi:hypothetical protein
LSKPSFEKLLLEAIDECLGSMGESSKLSIYFHIENRFKIKKQEISANIEVFSQALEGIFGIGASYLENMVLKIICQKTCLNREAGQLKQSTFPQTLLAVKKELEC